ncbi:MAG: hypothetical protein L0212_10880 [Acidobacteria bacterium]|nr:hypothetical protein [Acidobacteriota bacterium]
MRVLKIVAAILVALPSLAFLLIGGGVLMNWIRLRSGVAFYVDGNYLRSALFFILPGLAAFGIATYVLVRRQAHAAWLLVPLLIVALSLPNLLGEVPSALHAQRQPRAYARTASVALAAWAQKQRRFPANQSELEAVLTQHLGPDGRRESVYARGGQRVPYRFVYVGNSAGPHLPQPAGDTPAIIYCAVSADLKHLWVTVTVLDTNVSEKVDFLRESGRTSQPWVEEGKLNDAEKPSL